MMLHYSVPIPTASPRWIFSAEAAFKSRRWEIALALHKFVVWAGAISEAHMDDMDRKALGDLILVIFGVLTVLVVAALL